MDELSLAVVGINFPNTDRSKSNRRFELLQCRPGEPIDLVPEPKNKHDPNAIAVFSSRGIQIGYLTAERAPFIGGRLRSGVEAVAIFQQLNPDDAIIRLRFGGGEPTLPTATTSTGSRRPRPAPPPIDDDGFYPDPDGPEWGA